MNTRRIKFFLSLLLLLPLVSRAQSNSALKVIALAEAAGQAFSLLLLLGLVFYQLVRIPEEKLPHVAPSRIIYLMAVAAIGPLVTGSFTFLLLVCLDLFAHIELSDESLTWSAVLLAALMVLMLAKTKRKMAGWAVGVGSALCLLLVTNLSSGNSIPPVTPSSVSDPLGLIPTEVRDAPLPISVYAQTPRTLGSSSYDLAASDERPGFPGGATGLHDFVQERLRYPLTDRLLWRKGYVDVLFTIQDDGRITNITTVGEVGWYCAAEAQRVVELLPGFAPARRNGRPFAAKLVLTFAFN